MIDELSLQLVHALLRQANIVGEPTQIALLGDSTSDVWRFTVDGQPYVMRHRTDDDGQMVHKEMYLSNLLRAHGVPAPQVLAIIINDDGVGTLSTLLTGIRLDHALRSSRGTTYIALGTLQEQHYG